MSQRTTRTVKDSFDTILKFPGDKLVGTRERALEIVNKEIVKLSRQYAKMRLERDYDREDLFDKLEKVSSQLEKGKKESVKLEKSAASISLDGVPDTDKYLQSRLLEYRPVQVSTLGLANFMGVDHKSLNDKCQSGVDEILREVKDRSQVEEQRAEIENELENLLETSRIFL